jgi:hypothetical protein
MIYAFVLRYLPHLAVLAVLVIGVLYYGHRRYEAGHEDGVVATLKAERLCTEESICAETAVKRAAAQEAVVRAELAKAVELATQAKTEQLARETKARAAADARAALAKSEAATWEKRYRAALIESQSCAAFHVSPIPCPVE